MQNVDTWVKWVVGLLTGIVSIFTGLFGLVFTVLLGLMAIDFITGVIAGATNEGLSSKKGYKGLTKKVYVILLIGAVFMIEIAVLHSHGVITDGVSAAFCVAEFVSIVENGGKMGIRLPSYLTKMVETLKTKVGEKEIGE